jgi:hypothetical protein
MLINLSDLVIRSRLIDIALWSFFEKRSKSKNLCLLSLIGINVLVQASVQD